MEKKIREKLKIIADIWIINMEPNCRGQIAEK
jgi:hypothetical protein